MPGRKGIDCDRITDRCQMSFAELEILKFATLDNVIIDDNASFESSS